jgi:hypothetical protein
MHGGSQLLLITAIAGAVVAPSESRAGTVGGQTGQASRATIGIQLSVAPRMGIYSRNSTRPNAETAEQSFCVWSTGASHKFTATLQDEATGRVLTLYAASETDDSNLISKESLEATARSSAIACRSGDRRGDILLSQAQRMITDEKRAPGKALLIVAPE